MSLAKDITKINEELKKSLNKGNIYNVPKIEKIIVNVGIGTHLLKGAGRSAEEVQENIQKITGQRPIITRSKLAVSNFKLRKGVSNGVAVTLRGKIMYGFLEKLIKVALPRVRDFQGIPKKSFDGKGNYSFGVTDMTIFPEIFLDDISKTHGLQVTISIKSESDEDSFELLKTIGLPFKK